jgi:signal transduction histidine kinase
VVLSLLVLAVFILYWRRQQLKLKALQQERNLLFIVLDTGQESRCWWIEGQIHIHATPALIKLLGLNEEQIIEIHDIVNQFASQDACQLDVILREIVQTGEAFTYVGKLIDCTSVIEVKGARYLDNGKYLYVLYFADLTENRALFERQDQRITHLKKQNERLEILVNIAPMPMWYRGRTNRIELCNYVYSGILESTVEQVVAESRELIDQQRSTSPYHLAIQAKKTGQPQSKRGHIVVEGNRRLIEMTEVPVADKSETVGYALDLTDLEEAMDELSQHITSHQEVLHHLSTPIAVYSPDTRLQFFNNAYQKIFQFDEQWLHKNPTYAEVLQDLRERRKIPEYSDFQAFKRTQLQLFNTLIQPIQDLVHLPDGHILRQMIVPHPLGGLLFLYDDVTDKLALERRYNTLIAVQKETLDHLYEGIVVFGSDNRLRLSNPATARIWQLDMIDLAPGRHAGEILDQIRHLFTGYQDWEIFRQQLLGFINDRQSKTGRFSRVDHSMIQYSYVPLPDGSHLLTFVDVSDRWRFEQALSERNQALEQADRLKSDFLSHVSYELRAPLNTIIGFTEILMNQYFGSLNERQLDYCRGIGDSAQRLLGLINDILDLASIEAGQFNLKLQPVDLETFLSSLVTLVYNRSNDQGLEIIYVNNTDVKTFIGDERRLKQALFNLLTNAIKFTPSGGRIELTATLVDSDDGQDLCLSVKDTGVGMAPEDQERLFKLFSSDISENRGRFKYKGSGLGLPLVKSFVELHGGRIELHSQPGEGTIVSCYLPLLEPDELTIPLHDAAHENAPDDHQEIRVRFD